METYIVGSQIPAVITLRSSVGHLYAKYVARNKQEWEASVIYRAAQTLHIYN